MNVNEPMRLPSTDSRLDCAVCGGSRSSVVIRAARDLYLGVPGEWDYVRCDDCGLVQQHPMPTDTAAFYRVYPVHKQRSALFHAIRRLMMPDVYYAPPPGARPTLLDYGCGNGDYLQSLAAAGLSPVGYEPDAALAGRIESGSGLRIYHDLDALERAHPGGFDTMTLHCVLEHLPSPRIALSLARRFLKPGGLLYAVLPHFDCWEQRRFGRYWHALDAPRHLTFPDRRHLDRIAPEYGFRVTNQKNVCFPNNLAASIATALCGRFNWPITAALLPASWLTQLLRPTGTRAFWLSRDQ